MNELSILPYSSQVVKCLEGQSLIPLGIVASEEVGAYRKEVYEKIYGNEKTRKKL